MQHIFLDVDRLIEKTRESDTLEAAKTKPREKENWQQLAASWRLRAERTLAKRTGGDVLLH